MAYIGKRPEDALRGNASYNAFTGDGSTTTFDVTNLLPDGGAFDVEVFVDNVRQEAGASKSYTIGQDGSGDLKRITFNVAPDDGSEIYVINPGRTTATITVNDNTISAAKIQADAVTTAKITDSNVTAAKLASSLDLSSKTITLPNTSVTNAQLAGSIANAKLANSSITINGTAVSLGGSVTAGTDWQAVVVADGSTQLTATAGKGYFLDTNTGVIEVFLPASPSRGDTIFLADYGGNFATNNVLVNTNTQRIDSVDIPNAGQGYALSTNNLVVELVYVDSSKGWQIIENEAKSSLSLADDTNARFTEATGGTITTSGDFKIHTFTGDGCFVVSTEGNAAGGGNKVSYIVVAGGGAGARSAGGGGGAGGFREGKCTSDPYTASPLDAGAGLQVSAATFPITVGAGGATQTNPALGGNGSVATFSTITAAGGGGGNMNAPPGPGTGSAGGSGGGGGHGASASPRPTAGGAGNTPPVSPPQGNPGGQGSSVDNTGSGGGGGATAAGAVGGPGAPSSGLCGKGGNGGAGATTVITGSPVGYAGGGGGGSGCRPDNATGSDGGAPGGRGPSTNAGTATANRGGGGGGGGYCSSANGQSAGGSGIVVIRYKFQN